MKNVAIIGAGATGFAAARALASGASKYRVVLFDRQAQPGGIWLYTGSGPMYRSLDTNIFKQLMEYKDKPFDSQLPIYPDRRDVRSYLVQYSREIESYESVEVRWEAEVTQLSKNGSQWRVDFTEQDKVHSSKIFDYVVVASGHYDEPLYPPISGLEDLLTSKDSRVTHTRHYDRPDAYKNKKVLIVGNGASGVDIVIQLRAVTNQISVSRRHESKTDNLFGQDIDWRPEITNIQSDILVTFEDGTRETFDIVLFATGYKHKLQFLEKFSHESEIPLTHPEELRVQNLHKYVFYIGDPTLAFVGLNKNVVPMPLSECQGAVIAGVWSGVLKLPSTDEMLKEEEQLVAEKGSGKAYFVLGYPKDVEYMHFLNEWAECNPSAGFLAEKWDKEKCKMRSEVADAKLLDYSRKWKQSKEAYERDARGDG